MMHIGNKEGSMTTATQGMARVKELYENRSQRAKELRSDGKKVIGYLCCYSPVELMTAAGMVPYRLTGSLEPITEADAYIETLVCPYVRSLFDLGIKGEYRFLDGTIWPHTCDNIYKSYDIWKYYMKPDFWHFLDVPHQLYDTSFEFFKFQIALLKERLEDFAGVRISHQNLNDAIKLHNRNRGLLRELCELRKADPPLISGTEMTQVIVAVMTTPVEEANELVASVIEEVKERRERPEKKPCRLLVYGSVIDNIPFIELIEESGANVVIDDLCFGTRYYRQDVELSDDPLLSIAERYLDKVMCPRTHRPDLHTREKTLESRIGYLREYAIDYNANGVILYVLRFCDSCAFDAPEIRDYLQKAGLHVLHLEDDYSLTSIQGFRTRIQAFVEMVG